VATPHPTTDVAISGTLACVTDVFSGLRVIDITNPQSPRLVGAVETSGNALGVAIEGRTAVVVHTAEMFPALLPDPVRAKIAERAESLDGARAVAFSDSRGPASDWVAGLDVIDLADPSHPRILGSVDTPGAGEGIAVSGNRAYVADGVAGLQVIDIANPQSPRIAAGLYIPGSAIGVVVSDSHVYIGVSKSGLAILPLACGS
jgi:hypothetical protein